MMKNGLFLEVIFQTGPLAAAWMLGGLPPPPPLQSLTLATGARVISLMVQFVSHDKFI